jgi:hypothetical protein
MRTHAARSAGPFRDADPPSHGDLFDTGPCPRLRELLHFPRSSHARHAWRRAGAVVVVAWLPLLLLAAAEGALLGPGASLLRDVAAHTRYLVAMPLLVAAEPWCLKQLSAIAGHFARGGLVAAADLPRWEALVARVRRLLDGRGAEVVLVVAASVGATVLGVAIYPREVASWMVPDADGVLSAAGWWRVVVSQPLFLLVVFSWLWRVMVWARFLWGAARLELRLVPAHPDLAGGLRFVAVSLRAFAPVAFSFGAAVAGTLAQQAAAPEQPPAEFSYASGMLAFAAVALVLFAGPLFAFAGPLHRAWLRGILGYGALAEALGHRFEERWLAPGAAVGADALAAPDFSATTDLYSIAGNLRQMAIIPAGVRDLVMLVIAAILPFLPLVFVAVPFSTLLKRVAGVLL